MMNDKKTKRYIVAVIAFTILAITLSFYFYQGFFSPNALIDKDEPAYVQIPRNATFRQVTDSLLQNDILNDILTFSFVAKVSGYQEDIKPGLYKVEPKMNNHDLVKLLMSGRQSPVKLTFNNIRTKEELAEKITRNLEMSTEDFYALLTDTTYVKKFEFEPETVMSMFIPNTYEVWWNVTAEGLFDRMHKEYEKFWNEERTQRLANLNLNRKEVSTLASIVQAETQKADERPRVAGVYLNRLNLGMALQADPTLVFAHQDFGLKRVLNVHKEIDSPYNTYKNAGLPPGPINLPDISAIDAVLKYEDHNYMYFCAKEDFSGYHAFAVNYDEHLRNARRYQQALNQANY
ncbi:endolytic transglycosylase MltG [Anditalea andensis]|uniref:Endolytic murein transglycosylase n=1 Tax=Anditalea andensis TaxID=1048983 RepID=A0A074L5T9_9BACT|nr:endolytic transglycosylase MltG [Anditalea andensis]KEO75183.1 aminodeoxychorismate lyase [Anditalea andensis]